jgi:hypothetical protein
MPLAPTSIAYMNNKPYVEHGEDFTHEQKSKLSALKYHKTTKSFPFPLLVQLVVSPASCGSQLRALIFFPFFLSFSLFMHASSPEETVLKNVKSLSF